VKNIFFSNTLHRRVGEKNILTIFLGILKKTFLGIPSKKNIF